MGIVWRRCQVCSLCLKNLSHWNTLQQNSPGTPPPPLPPSPIADTSVCAAGQCAGVRWITLCLMDCMPMGVPGPLVYLKVPSLTAVGLDLLFDGQGFVSVAVTPGAFICSARAVQTSLSPLNYPSYTHSPRNDLDQQAGNRQCKRHGTAQSLASPHGVPPRPRASKALGCCRAVR